MMKHFLSFTLTAALLTGCAALQIHPQEPAALTAVKVVSRVGLCAISFCFSEADFAMMREGMSREERARVWQGVSASFNDTTRAINATSYRPTAQCQTVCRPNCLPASACGYAQTCSTVCE